MMTENERRIVEQENLDVYEPYYAKPRSKLEAIGIADDADLEKIAIVAAASRRH